jgi:hypothetical protein
MVILKSKIKDAIIRAVEKENKKLTDKYEKDIKILESRLEYEHQLELEERDAEIELLRKQIGKSENKMNRAEDLYYESFHQVKKNRELAIDIEYHVSEFFSSSAEFFQALKTLKDKSELYNKRWEKKKSEKKKYLKEGS